jgi:hypothetical protein
MKQHGPALVATLIDKIDSTKFDKEVFDQTGVFIIRNALPKGVVEQWKEEWDAFYRKLPASGGNGPFGSPLTEPLPDKLANMYKNETLLDFAEQVFGENVAMFNHRFIVKDRLRPARPPTQASVDSSNVTSHVATFLHHDYCYHIGNTNKASFFVPLTHAGKKNGGVTYFLGTHKYGYLGDLGEIDPDQFQEIWPQVTPELEPGDFSIMHSLLWHKSGVNEGDADRVVVDTIYQPADDPSGKELVRGQWQTEVFIQHSKRYDYFKTSRVKTIRELKEKVKGGGQAA